jgi:hypothetical protein
MISGLQKAWKYIFNTIQVCFMSIKYRKRLKESLHKAGKEVTSLNERQSLPELRVICAIAGEGGTDLPATWSCRNSLGDSHTRSKQ